MSAVRKIAARTAEDQYRFSEIVLGIVESDPFRKRIVEAPAAEPAGH
jgi:hypothetical protein